MIRVRGLLSPMGCSGRTPRRGRNRRGSIILLAAVFTIVVLAVLAFSVDFGHMLKVRAEMDRAVDAAALAGAGSLIDGTAAANQAALDVMLRNPVGDQILVDEVDREAKLQAWLAQHEGDFETEVGHFNIETKTFSESDVLPSAIHITAKYEYPNLFFARIFGNSSFEVRAEAIARYQPRDIVLVVDYSGSMSDDSKLQRIVESGETWRTKIVENLQQIYQELGSPVYGTMTFDPVYISSTNKSTIKQTLGLRYQVNKKWGEVPYPYSSGSWNDYIDYMTNSGNRRVWGGNVPEKAGYSKKYGYLTLVDYWLECQPSFAQTRDLWKVSQQPIKTVKDAVGVFMQYIQEIEDCDDRLALVVYNSVSQDALLEKSLTSDFASVQDTVNHRQAGHYDPYTNIGAGLRVACEELASHSRTGAKKMIVLLTDGQANKPVSVDYARQYVLDQAALANGSHYQVFTISLGSEADQTLMQQVADATKGTHFNIPGGAEISSYEANLLKAFRKIADARPLLLVK